MGETGRERFRVRLGQERHDELGSPLEQPGLVTSRRVNVTVWSRTREFLVVRAMDREPEKLPPITRREIITAVAIFLLGMVLLQHFW